MQEDRPTWIVEDDQGEGYTELAEDYLIPNPPIKPPLPKGTKELLEEMKRRVRALTEKVEDKP